MSAIFNLIAFFRRRHLRECASCGARNPRASMLHDSLLSWYCSNECRLQDWHANAW